MQMKSKIAFGAVLGTAFCVALLATQQCHSNTTATTIDKYAESQFAAAMANDPTGQNTLAKRLPGWLAEKWTGDDTDYKKARQEIDDSSVSPKVFEAMHQLQAAHQPHSAIAQFRWAYALWKSMAQEQPGSERAGNISTLFYALAKADDPDAYDYSRLRYLVSPSSKDTPILGERLLKQSPNDDEVKLSLAVDYAFDVGVSGSPQSKARALDLTHQLLQTDPKRARYHGILGMVYEGSYGHRHNTPDAEAAIAANQKYLSLVDPHGEYAQMTRGAIAELKADLTKDANN